MTRKTYSDSRSLVAVSRVHGHRRLLCRLLKLARANWGDLGVGFRAFYASMLRCATVLVAAIPRAAVLRRENPRCAAARVVRFQASAFLQLTWCA
jgi:hypothetical protein